MMASSTVLQTPIIPSTSVESLHFSPVSWHRINESAPLQRISHRGLSISTRDRILRGIQCRRAYSAFHVVKATASSSDSVEDLLASTGTERKDGEDGIADAPTIWGSSTEVQQAGIVSFVSRPALQSLTQDVAMGLVLREAAGTGWTTGSGLEGPTGELENAGKEELKFPDLSKSPRRKMRVAFTCNMCGERTIRAINPLAYTDGTVFVQCKGCDVFHKLVDNLNLFHEMNGKIYRGYDIPWYANDQPYNCYGDQYPIL